MKMKKYTGIILFLAAILMLTGCTRGMLAFKTSENLGNIHFYGDFGAVSEELRYWDSSENLFYYFLPSGIPTDRLTVRTENGITLRPADAGGGRRHHFKNGETLNGIKPNQIYLLGCYDIHRYLYEVPVIFLKSENTYSMHIHTASGNVYPAMENKDLKLGGSMLLADSSGDVIYRGELDHLKGRGNGSWYSFKKPFNIKLDKEADLLGTGNSRKYALLNQESDPSAIRNKLAFRISEAVGLPFTPGSEYVDLWLDGNYQGLYLLTDRIQIGHSSVDIPSLEEETQKLNSMPLKDYPIVTTPGMRYSEIPNNPDDITGGYLLEVDRFYTMDKNAWFNTFKMDSVTLKSPSYAAKAQVDYLHHLFQEMELKFASSSDTTEYRKYIDEESWAKMGMLQELFVNSDFMGSSQYFYKPPDHNGVRSPIYAAPVWDMDQTLGPDTRSYLPSNTLLLPSHRWYQDLVKNPYFEEALRKTFLDDFVPVLNDLLDHGIDEMTETIRPALNMNYIRWKQAAISSFGSENPSQQAQESLKKYLSKRVQLLSGYLQNPDDYHHIIYTRDNFFHPDMAPYYQHMVVKHGEICDAPLSPRSPIARFAFWHTSVPPEVGDPFDFSAPVTEDAMLYAHYIYLTPEELAAANAAAAEPTE